MANDRISNNKKLLEEYAVTKDPQVLKRLVLENQLLAWKAAQKHIHFSPASLTVSDLFHDGITGLIDALQRFEVQKGYALSTYSVWWVERNIRRAKSDRGEMIRYPENFARKLAKIRRAENEYYANGIDTMSVADYVMSKTGLDEEQYHQVLATDSMCSQVASVHELRGGEDDTRELGEDVTYQSQSQHMTVHREFMDASDLICEMDRDQLLAKALCLLPAQQQTVLAMHFGLNEHHVHSMTEIADSLFMNKSKAQRLIRDGLSQLRTIFEAWNIRLEDVA